MSKTKPKPKSNDKLVNVINNYSNLNLNQGCDWNLFLNDDKKSKLSEKSKHHIDYNKNYDKWEEANKSLKFSQNHKDFNNLLNIDKNDKSLSNFSSALYAIFSFTADKNVSFFRKKEKKSKVKKLLECKRFIFFSHKIECTFAIKWMTLIIDFFAIAFFH